MKFRETNLAFEIIRKLEVVVIGAEVGVTRNHNRVAGGQAIRARTGNQSSYGGLVKLVNHWKRTVE